MPSSILDQSFVLINDEYYCPLNMYQINLEHHARLSLQNGGSFGLHVFEVRANTLINQNLDDIIQIQYINQTFTLIKCPIEWYGTRNTIHHQIIKSGFEILNCAEKVMNERFDAIINETKAKDDYIIELRRQIICLESKTRIFQLQEQRAVEPIPEQRAVEPIPEHISISTQTECPHGDRYVSHVEVIPIYDYELIKENRKQLHREFRTVFKFFKQLIQLRYETPVAVLVLK